MEDVSKELRKVMDLSEGSDDADMAGNEFLKRPTGPPIGMPPPSPPIVAVVGGVNLKGVNLAGESPSSSPRFQRPSAAKSRDRSNSNKGMEEPTAPVKSSLQPITQLAPLSIPVGGVVVPGKIGVTIETGMAKSSTVKPLSKETSQQPDASSRVREAQLEMEHNTAIERLKRSHAEELAKLRQQFACELEDLKESLTNQNEINLDSFRKKLAAEQLLDEKQLRTQKETFLSALKSRLKEEGDEEEARLMEAKQDTIRKLKQQVSVSLITVFVL